jgi:hypothetical protein
MKNTWIELNLFSSYLFNDSFHLHKLFAAETEDDIPTRIKKIMEGSRGSQFSEHFPNGRKVLDQH